MLEGSNNHKTRSVFVNECSFMVCQEMDRFSSLIKNWAHIQKHDPNLGMKNAVQKLFLREPFIQVEGAFAHILKPLN